MGVTDDRSDPRLMHGVDEEPVPMAEVYLVLSEAERAKGFIRPYRDTYRHVGVRPTYPLQPLTADQQARYAEVGYVAYEPYPSIREGNITSRDSGPLGKYWTQAELDSGCGTVTIMGRALAETYAREPKFYGATYCVGCKRHRPVAEFVWEKDGQVLGS